MNPNNVGPLPQPGDVTLSFRAITANVALARTMAAALAARTHLTIDQIEDVRLAIDEAVSQLINDCDEQTHIHCDFTETAGTLLIRVGANTRTGLPPATDTFSWLVLAALVDEVTAGADNGIVKLELRIKRPASVTV
ncbi:MAG: anti-sigma factor [Candidatus Nanopelagicales bacterium]